MTSQLVSWDSISLRVNGARVNALARQQVAGQLDDLNITFRKGNIHVAGHKKVVFVKLPFSADISSIRVDGTTIIAPVSDVSHIPAPLLGLFLPLIRGMISARLPVDAVTVRPPLTFVIQLDRLLPPFVDVEIKAIRIDDGGVEIELGAGGVRSSVLRSPTRDSRPGAG